MKFSLLKRTLQPLCLIVMLGLVLMSAGPSQSLDSMIAFSSDREGRLDIFVMKSDGSRQRNLTKNPASVHIDPAWSPNSRKIGFDSNRNGNYEIYLMDANGDNPTNLTQNPAGDIGGSWVLGELAVSPKASSLTSWGKIKTLQGDER